MAVARVVPDEEGEGDASEDVEPVGVDGDESEE
jgi:hypothetical protein